MIDGQRFHGAAARLGADVRDSRLDERKHQARAATVVFCAASLRVDALRASPCLVDTDSIEQAEVLLVRDYTYIAKRPGSTAAGVL
ncbi:MAG TPA: hypothetical protein VN634_12730 [Candidatus Limnocylindrales bacterium]|nr:hypothetical protein [Candidatus Limnocylindrales bacterium]